MDRSKFHSHVGIVNVAQWLLDLGALHKVATTPYQLYTTKRSSTNVAS